jgi:hypothetical protein
VALDSFRAKLLEIMKSNLENAIKEKQVHPITLMLKDAVILYKEFHKQSSKQEFPESFQIMNQIKK